MTKPEKIYLAGAFFNDVERKTIEDIACKLRKQGYIVYVPMENVVPNAWEMSNQDWASCVFDDDIIAINSSDCVVAVITNGMNDDTGTIFEIGYAYGKDMNVYVIHNYDYTKNITSLMVWNSAYRNFNIETLDSPDWYKSENTINIEQK